MGSPIAIDYNQIYSSELIRRCTEAVARSIRVSWWPICSINTINACNDRVGVSSVLIDFDLKFQDHSDGVSVVIVSTGG